MRLPDHVALRRFDDEAVLLNLETGHYHGLDSVGGAYLAALEEHDDLNDAVDALAADYGVPRQRVVDDMREFCHGLRERGLIELDPDET